MGLHPVGRLDYDTSGLILFSSSGDLTQRLLHPRHEVEKEYVASVENTMNIDGELLLKKQLEIDGVTTSEGIHNAELVSITNGCDVRLIVKEGKHRMVRRMLANCGHPVIKLRRLRHGLCVIDGLDIGKFRVANTSEIKWAENLVVDGKQR